MEYLPVELMEIICKNLDITSIIFLSMTCKKFLKLTINKNITNNFKIINKKELCIGFKNNHKLKYKKVIIYTCGNCGDISHYIKDLVTICSKCKKYICNKKIYDGIEYCNNNWFFRYNDIICFDCIPNDKFIHKNQNKYISLFSSPQYFNRNEWFKKTD